MDESLIPTFSLLEVETTGTDVYTGGLYDTQEFMAKPWYPYLLVIVCILVVLALPGNVLTMYAFFKYPQLQTPTNFLICSQSLADILFILTAQFLLWTQFSTTGLQLVSQQKYACLASLWTTLFSLLISLTNIFCLSLERLIAVVWSLEYFNFVTEKRIKRSIMFCWIAVLAFASLPLFGLNTWQAGGRCEAYMAYPAIYTLLYILLGAVFLVLMTINNMIICFIAASKQNIVVPHGQPSTSSGKPNSSTPRQTEVLPESERMNALRATNYKITKMFLIVVGVFYLSIIPCFLSTTLYILKPAQSWKIEGHPDWFLFLHDVAKCFLVINAVVNPFIYAKKSKRYKIAFMKILGFKQSSIVQAELE